MVAWFNWIFFFVVRRFEVIFGQIIECKWSENKEKYYYYYYYFSWRTQAHHINYSWPEAPRIPENFLDCLRLGCVPCQHQIAACQFGLCEVDTGWEPIRVCLARMRCILSLPNCQSVNIIKYINDVCRMQTSNETSFSSSSSSSAHIFTKWNVKQ